MISLVAWGHCAFDVIILSYGTVYSFGDIVGDIVLGLSDIVEGKDDNSTVRSSWGG